MEKKGSLVLVTGGAKRFGAILVRAFAGVGAKVIIHCNTSEKEALALLDEIGGTDAGHSIVKADLSDPSGISAFFSTLPDDLSVVVNNASVFVRKQAPAESYAEMMEQLSINALSPIEIIKAFYRHSRQPELSCVNILDGGCNSVPSDSFSYALSKKLLAEATRAAAKQFAPRMRINGVAPGPMFPPPGLEHLKMAKTLAVLPLGRPVSPEEVAEAVLLAAYSSTVTGAVIHADAGRNLI